MIVLKKIFLNIISIISFSPFITNVTEDDISKNITQLKKNKWFKDLLQDHRFRQFIIHDREIRTVIGEFNSDTLMKNPYRKRYKRKIMRAFRYKKII